MIGQEITKEQLSVLIKIQSSTVEAWVSNAESLYKLGKYDEAIKWYDKSLAINPNNDDTWNNKGNALDDLGKYNEAIKCYDKSLAINPDNYYCWYNKGMSLHKLGKDDEAGQEQASADVLDQVVDE